MSTTPRTSSALLVDATTVSHIAMLMPRATDKNMTARRDGNITVPQLDLGGYRRRIDLLPTAKTHSGVERTSHLFVGVIGSGTIQPSLEAGH